jgi:hypothetical protein
MFAFSLDEFIVSFYLCCCFFVSALFPFCFPLLHFLLPFLFYLCAFFACLILLKSLIFCSVVVVRWGVGVLLFIVHSHLCIGDIVMDGRDLFFVIFVACFLFRLHLLLYICLSAAIFLSSYFLVSIGAMDRYWPALTQPNVVQGLGDFLGEHILVDMDELLADCAGGVAMVLACFLGVDEGVDLWFSGSDPLVSPRFDFVYYL